MIHEETRYMTDGKPAPCGSPVPVALALLDRWWPDRYHTLARALGAIGDRP